jgi:hypothetical protein
MFLNNLLLECAEFGCIYPDGDFFKMALKSWSEMELSTWNWLLDTQHYEYNPIWNVDVHDSERIDNKETRNLQGTNNETRNLQGTNNETRDLQGTNNETRNLAGTNNNTKNLTTTDTGTVNTKFSDNDIQEVDVNAFNSGSGTRRETTTTRYGKNELETRNLSSNTSGTDNYQSTDTGTDNYITTDTGTDNYITTDTGTDNYITTDTGTIDNNNKREFYKRGNQGVTTTQQMIREEQSLAKFNIDDYIINEFKKRFCILLY